MVTLIEHSKLAARGQDAFQANLTLGVVLSIKRACLRRAFFTHLVRIGTTITVPAAIRLEEHAYLFLGLIGCASLPLAGKEFFDPRVVLIVLPVLIALVTTPSSSEASINLSGADRFDDTDLDWDRVVAQDDSLAYLALGQLVIVLEVVRIVATAANRSTIAIIHHHWWLPRHHRIVLHMHLLHLHWTDTSAAKLTCHVLNARE